MKKKLLALAVAGAFVAPVAMADTSNVNVYGLASVSFDSVSNGSGAADGTPSTNYGKVSSNGSRIGFKGTEDLGGGTSAVWQIESAVAIDGNATSTLGTRNTFAGLSGDGWGSLVLGRNDSPYKTANRGLDLFADTIADNRTLMGGANGGTSAVGVAFDGRNTDSITYTSPNMSGFSLAAQYSAAAAENAAPATLAVGAGQKGDLWSLAGMYNVAPLYVSLAYEAHSNAVAAAVSQTKERAWRLGAAYKTDQFEANFAYESTSDDSGSKSALTALVAACDAAAVAAGIVNTGADCAGHKAYTIAGKYNISGSDAVKLAYTKAKEFNFAGLGANATDANQFSIGYDHNMSKRTTVYALYTKLNNNTNASYALGNAGYATGVTAAASAAGGSDPSAISLGLKHVF